MKGDLYAKKLFLVGLAIMMMLLSIEPVLATEYNVSDEELRDAYIVFSERLAEKKISATICLEDFIDGYSGEQGKSINQYIEELVEYEVEVYYINLNSIQINASFDTASKTRSVASRWYDNIGKTTPTLPQAASYTEYNIENVVKKGDIVYETEGSVAQFTGHIALVQGTYYDSTYAQFYIRTIEAGAYGVVYGVLDDTRYEERGIKVYKVSSADAYQKADAIDFCLAQLGESYTLWKSTSEHCSYSDSNSQWYCSELVWAAYYNQGINLNGSSIPYNFFTPAELASSSHLTRRTISAD